MENLSFITTRIAQSIAVKELLIQNTSLLNIVSEVAEKMVQTYRLDGKVLFCGNGGSAADAQHIAAELSGRFYIDRDPLYAEALHVNTSYLTAVANDYSYDEVYARIIKAQGRKGDILVGISTSGNSKNVINALVMAKQQGMLTVALTGESGGKMKPLSDFLINIPSSDTPRIQESHILIGHIICEMVELALFNKK